MTSTDTNPRTRKRIAVIGAGPGGLCTGIQLKRAGFDNFVILEKSGGVGGTWWHNRYPGAACDVQSHLYSFSFEPKDDWSRPFAPQPEILRYMEHCAAKYGLEPHLRLNTALRSARWDDAESVWQLSTDTGEELTADVVVSALGMFNELHWPEIAGMDEFEGKIFHSARWDHAHDLSGETVGVIGSAASAVQFVPEIAKEVGQLYLYQRTANWVLPKEDDPFTPEQLERFRADPQLGHERRSKIYRWIDAVITFSNKQGLKDAEQAGRRAISVVKDSELREKLTPTHPYGCKRPLISNVYFETFNRPSVELVTEPIEKITRQAIVNADGSTRQVDTIVVATGFATTKYLSAVEVIGRGGRRIEDAWSDGAQAYLGIATAGFPNLFMLYGPNTNNGSILFMLECQVDYIIQQLERLTGEDLAWLDVRRDVMERYNAQMQRDIGTIDVWQADCLGYYRSPSGRVVTQWPHSMTEYRARTARPDPDAYEVSAR